MKKTLVLAVATSLALAGSAYAGGLAPAVEETPPMVMMDEPTGSLGTLIVPLILVALLAVANSSDSTSTDDDL